MSTPGYFQTSTGQANCCDSIKEKKKKAFPSIAKSKEDTLGL